MNPLEGVFYQSYKVKPVQVSLVNQWLPCHWVGTMVEKQILRRQFYEYRSIR